MVDYSQFKLHTHTFPSMGTDINLKVFTNKHKTIERDIKLVELEFKRIVGKYSRFDKNSYLMSYINNSNGEKIEIDKETFDLISYGTFISKITNEIFDPTIIDILEFIGYSTQPKNNNDISDLVKIINNRPKVENIQIYNENNKYHLKLCQNQRIEFGGYGKGYAVDRSIEILRHHENVIIDAGGDIRVLGHNENKDNFKVALWNKNHEVNLYTLLENEDSIACSSSYGKLFNKISHIINKGKLTDHNNPEQISHVFVKIHHKLLENDYKRFFGFLPVCTIADTFSTISFIDSEITKNCLKDAVEIKVVK